MKIVLDTNVLINSFLPQSKNYGMWKALEAQQLTLCVTTDILLEYEKFADCAIAVSADYLVTNDRHFNPLKKLPFPILKIVNEDEFHTIFKAILKKKPKND